ncbi:acyl-CoA thioesterase II [Desulfuromonas sp. TF]|uniref:acyl-CoA thioesterase II n=1 Tax=Desulfuromonas sp. TF TaxID=1232410 RepID=UPI000406F8C9|nr:acyl-CoA thioesterase II [Desulfuromonas sp. TF]
MKDNLLKDLLDHLTLEPLGNDRFRGESRSVGGKSVFGGQVLGQALLAADATVEGRRAHSLHAYFLLAGDPQAPIVYEVERIRDGRSFATRRVVAVQHGRAIFNMAVSFQVDEEGLDHHAAMPDVPGPEGLPSGSELYRQIADQLPENRRDALTAERPIELRPVRPRDLLNPERRPPQRQVWLRTVGALPDDPALHQAMLAYASDFTLLGTALYPHGLSFFNPEVQALSLDHAMWFHRSFRMDDWLLYAMDSPSASAGRGLGRGSIFTRDGRLVASVAQEGLIRLRKAL